ncbi:hypothetical protein NE237_019662 [Protea cynaroides]|uniref:IST1-like protein n=1 Tax=Protea cynaroides TaxID=273540 RepID=A0A9Q0H4K5_9MAGN|nr:hypothetical protein NE237_019662 [Protea cynaroides]
MGKKLDALLGRGFKTAKFKTLVNLAISRIAVLKNQRQVRCSMARSDVVQLLNLGNHERALLRVELVIKEQNMLDAFVMIESYCNLLIERVVLISNNKECPDELKEAISSLIFAASRCGEFPELQEIRYLFTSRYGKEFSSSVVELRNNCGVNPRIIQKMSTRQPSLESKMKLLKEIASENGITLKHQEESSVISEEVEVKVKVEVNQKQQEPTAKLDSDKHRDEVYDLTEKIEGDEKLSESMKARKKYRDVVSAAQAAYKSAVFAAEAARAAVELSLESPLENQSDDPSSPLDKIHPAESSSSDSEGDEPAKNHQEIQTKELERSESASSSDSVEDTFKEDEMSPIQKPGVPAYDESNDEISETVVSYESDDEAKIEENKNSPVGFNGKSSNEFRRTDEDLSDLDVSIKHMNLTSQDDQHNHLYTNKEVIGSRNEDDPMLYPGKGGSYMEKEQVSAPRLNIGRKPVSVRTRRA